MSAANPFEIREGDHLPILEGFARYRDRQNKLQPFDFSLWTGFTFTAVGATKTITGPAVGAPNGLLSYQWTGTDTDTPGLYKGKFRGLDAMGRPQTFPTKGYISILIEPA